MKDITVAGEQPTLRLAGPADADAIDALMKISTAAIFPRFYSQAETDAAVECIASVDPALIEDDTYFRGCWAIRRSDRQRSP
jgi:hypothetical protein